MTKFIRTLVIINGLLLPAFLGFLGYSLIKSEFQSDYDEEPSGIIVGEEVEEARKDSLVLQGIDVGTPISIDNSTNYYLTISVKTYEEPRYAASRGEPVSLGTYYEYDCMNVVFLDKDFKLLGKLLDKNGSITEINAPGDAFRDHNYMDIWLDTVVHHITYQIGFEDTDKDGLINHLDARDLYISNLDGTGLTQVTKGWEINYSRFVKSGKKLFICYKSDDEHPDEYKHSKFALYDIKSGSLALLSDIDDTLKSIEHDLIK
jgi:hypothetical protein